MAQRTFRITAPAEDRARVEALLAAQGFSCAAEPFSPAARRLSAEPFPLGSSLAAFFGLIYIQDRSSMLPPLCLEAGSMEDDAGLRLDMCASPGGKTGILAALAGRRGFVLAAEASRERLATLRQNLRRAAATNVATLGAEAQHLALAPGTFDRILLDPPCSGWGTVEKNPRVLALWTPEKAETLARLQRELLRRAADLLKPGGLLLYSTCTTNTAENEAQAAWAASELPLVPDPLSTPAGFTPKAPTLPGVTGALRIGGAGRAEGETTSEGEGQGFFLARFRKDAAATPAVTSAEDFAAAGGDPGGRRLAARDLARARESCGADFSRLPPGELRAFGDAVYFLHARALELCAAAGLGQLRWQGFFLGRMHGGVFVPAARARILLPPSGDLPASRRLDVEEPAPIRDLLAGRSLEAAEPAGKGRSGGGLAGLYFRGLPLGWLVRKGRRLLWSER